jgi:dTDP-4-dehydrorhamnose 3,5-epimerase
VSQPAPQQSLDVELPSGVRLRALEQHPDERGVFTEVFRDEWDTGIDPVQWNLVTSEAGVLRGVHVHVRHWDYLIICRGHAVVGLRDLRSGTPTEGRTALLDCRGDSLTAITIPPGVAHGFLFLTPSTHLYAVSHTWHVDDEKACHWADPALGIEWPVSSAVVSPRDASAQPLAVLLEEIEPHQPFEQGQ